MNDIFLEQLVPKKKTAKDRLFAGIFIFLGVIVSFAMLALLFLAALAMQGNSMGDIRSLVFSVGLLLVGLEWYAIKLLLNTRNVEFEYIVTNSEIDIDKVMSKKGRKHLVTIDIKEAALMARIDDEENNSVYKNPPEGVHILNYSAMSTTGFTYFIDCNIDDKRTLVLFQPTQKMVEALWKFNPRAVKKYA